MFYYVLLNFIHRHWHRHWQQNIIIDQLSLTASRPFIHSFIHRSLNRSIPHQSLTHPPITLSHIHSSTDHHISARTASLCWAVTAGVCSHRQVGGLGMEGLLMRHTLEFSDCIRVWKCGKRKWGEMLLNVGRWASGWESNWKERNKGEKKERKTKRKKREVTQIRSSLLITKYITIHTHTDRSLSYIATTAVPHSGAWRRCNCDVCCERTERPRIDLSGLVSRRRQANTNAGSCGSCYRGKKRRHCDCRRRFCYWLGESMPYLVFSKQKKY